MEDHHKKPPWTDGTALDGRQTRRHSEFSRVLSIIKDTGCQLDIRRVSSHPDDWSMCGRAVDATRDFDGGQRYHVNQAIPRMQMVRVIWPLM